MTLKNEMMPLVVPDHEKQIDVKIKPKKEKPKPSKVEQELKKVQACLKNKDERIEVLEQANNDAEDTKTYLVDTFNFLSLFFFTIAVIVLLVVCNHFHHKWFMDVAPLIALWGSLCIGSNLFIGVASLIYEKQEKENDHDADIAMIYIVFNCIVLPIVFGVHLFFIAMFESMQTY